MLQDSNNMLHFSVASLWEVVIKDALDRPDFSADATVLRRGLINNGYQEVHVEGHHVDTKLKLSAVGVTPI